MFKWHRAEKTEKIQLHYRCDGRVNSPEASSNLGLFKFKCRFFSRILLKLTANRTENETYDVVGGSTLGCRHARPAVASSPEKGGSK